MCLPNTHVHLFRSSQLQLIWPPFLQQPLFSGTPPPSTHDSAAQSREGLLDGVHLRPAVCPFPPVQGVPHFCYNLGHENPKMSSHRPPRKQGQPVLLGVHLCSVWDAGHRELLSPRFLRIAHRRHFLQPRRSAVTWRRVNRKSLCCGSKRSCSLLYHS